MKLFPIILALLAIIPGSCSAYKRVSLHNFDRYQISREERQGQQYVLKRYRLHYVAAESKHNIHDVHETGGTPVEETYSFLIEDNIVIPAGAHGVCTDPRDDPFIIDFGEGIQIPFRVSDGHNRAGHEIMVHERLYRLKGSNRNPSLFFRITE